MLSQKKTHFKGISLRPKKSRRVPIRPTDMRFGGGVQYNHDTIEVSADNRRSTKTSFPVEITSENPVTTRMEVDEYHQEHEYPGFDSSVPEDADFTERVSRSSVICEVPLQAWIPHREQFLFDLNVLEGPGVHATNSCYVCEADDPEGLIRCTDCFGDHLYCTNCTLRIHHFTPLHRIKIWNKSHFKRTDLYSIGLTIQVGHVHGQKCLHPQAADSNFMVIHTTGIHRVRLLFCDCPREKPCSYHQQLLQARWWPASLKRPKTCVTIEVLHHFHKQTLQGKISAFDFYRGLELETDNTGLVYLPDRLASFMLVIRQYRHIKSLQRGGRGHEPGGILGTQRGELAVKCLACPHPGLNLPDGWERCPKDKQWLYRLMLSNDANFRLDSVLRSSIDKDPWLGYGYSYFVEDEPYNSWVLGHAAEEEITTCAGFAAILKANTTRMKGLRSTGVGAVVCVHDSWRPNGIGDLQKGERYCNMDYIWLSTLKHSKNKKILAIYDIMCQWSRKLFTRIKGLPELIQRPLDPDDVEVAIPKLHIHAHGIECFSPYSLNFKHGVGRVDGEGVERCWSMLNGVSRSTRQMGPGSRKDTIEDHCGHANWRKGVNMGSGLRARMEQALVMAVEHRIAFEELDEGLTALRPDDVQSWNGVWDAYELDKSKPSPYENPRTVLTQKKLRLRFAQEEAQAAEGSATSGAGLGAFLTTGLDLEQMQRSLAFELTGTNTDAKAVRVAEYRLGFNRKLTKYRSLRSAHMPGLVVNSDQDSPTPASPHLVYLHLPSSIPQAERVSVAPHAVYEAEAEIRFCQATDALDELRRHLRTRTCTQRFKLKNITGQRASTRARTLQKGIDARVKLAAAKYRCAREAYLSLVGPGDWERVLRRLEPEDVRSMNERSLNEHEKEEHRKARSWMGLSNEGVFEVAGGVAGGPGEGNRTLSWIWCQTTELEDDDNELDMHEALRVEWSKSKARMLRWGETVEMVREEMRRVLATLRSDAETWMTRAAYSDISTGHVCYADRHAHTLLSMATHFEWMWAPCSVRADAYLKAQNLTSELESLLSTSAISGSSSTLLDPQDEDNWM